MGEPNPYFCDFGIFEPVAKPQNQLFLFLETLGHLEKTPTFLNIIFINLGVLEPPQMLFFEKAGTDK